MPLHVCISSCWTTQLIEVILGDEDKDRSIVRLLGQRCSQEKSVNGSHVIGVTTMHICGSVEGESRTRQESRGCMRLGMRESLRSVATIIECTQSYQVCWPSEIGRPSVRLCEYLTCSDAYSQADQPAETRAPRGPAWKLEAIECVTRFFFRTSTTLLGS